MCPSDNGREGGACAPKSLSKNLTLYIICDIMNVVHVALDHMDARICVTDRSSLVKLLHT